VRLSVHTDRHTWCSTPSLAAAVRLSVHTDRRTSTAAALSQHQRVIQHQSESHLSQAHNEPLVTSDASQPAQGLTVAHMTVWPVVTTAVSM